MIYTNVSKSYLQSWSWMEGIREFIQNGLDADSEGNSLAIGHVRRQNKLIIKTRNKCLAKSTLLLGHSEKKSQEARGKFGEGYKLGSLACIRTGHPVTIHNGPNLWTPVIEKHPELKEDVLAFDTVDNFNPGHEDLIFQVDGVTPEEFKAIKNMFLPLSIINKENMWESPMGYVLQEAQYKGKIFCGGIYVTTDKDLAYGYDFRPSVLNLNRDRDMVSNFDLLWNTSKIWAYLSTSKHKLMSITHNLIKIDSPDIQYIDNFDHHTISSSLVTKFHKENGDTAIPVKDEADARTARSHGYTPVYSSSSYVASYSKTGGTLEEMVKKVSVSWDVFRNVTLTDEANIKWVFELLFAYDPKFKWEIEIVKFRVDATSFSHTDDKTYINHLTLKDKYMLLDSVVDYYVWRNNKNSTKQITHSSVWREIYRKTVEGINA